MTLPPNYAAVAADDNLAHALGMEGHGLLLWLLRNSAPSPHPAGAWITTGSADTIAETLGWGRQKVMRYLRDFRSLGLIASVEGIRLGRGIGMTPTRHYMLTDPSMTPPPNHPQGDRQAQDVRSQNKPAQDRTAQNDRAQPRHLVGVTNYTDVIPTHLMNEDDEPSSGRMIPAPPNTGIVERALRPLGWTGSLPDPSVHAPDAIIALTEWLKTQQHIERKGAYLRRLLSQGPAAETCAQLGIRSVGGSTQAAEDTAPSPVALSPEEYWDRAYADPEWKLAVETEARRIANLTGQKVTLALLRRIAAETPSPQRGALSG